jgi:2-succinyl-5-enolpyruvyl-6-hydroxy-3-cyclohexene-1-carboxylate synthase
MSPDANSAFARCLVDEWSRAGLTDAVASPGSRSTPLALALADHPGFRVHVHLDERSAGFFGLGLAKASGRPAVVVCTSGTAAANFHPAVLEAFHSREPMIVCTADRPPELRDVGAGQSVDQSHLYGRAVRWYFEPDPPGDGNEMNGTWRWMAARALAEAQGPPSGPVHLNLPFRDPLVPGRTPEKPDEVPSFGLGSRKGDDPWVGVKRPRRIADSGIVEALSTRVASTTRGIVVAGWGAAVGSDPICRIARAARWPILADPISSLRVGEMAVSTYDALSRIDQVREELAPDLVLRVGAPLTSKHAMSWLGKAPMVMIGPDRSWSDPQRAAEQVLEVEPDSLLEAVADRVDRDRDDSWLSSWMQAESRARSVIDALLDSWSEPFEGRIARDVMSGIPDASALVVASSMPVRDLETFARPRAGITVMANRGVNGIDGFVSTVLGIAAGRARPSTVALVGDLCLLHDANGLLASSRRGIDAVFVVLDNNGGGIFSFLPQAALPAHFEQLFGTPQDVDFHRLGALYGVGVRDVPHSEDLVPAIHGAIAAGGVQIVRAVTERHENLERHREVIRAVGEAFVR